MYKEMIPNELDLTDKLDQIPNGVYTYSNLYYKIN